MRKTFKSVTPRLANISFDEFKVAGKIERSFKYASYESDITIRYWSNESLCNAIIAQFEMDRLDKRIKIPYDEKVA